MGERDGLIVQSVSKSFKTGIVLQNVTFETRRGEALLLRGPNGSGKSTLVGLISGIYKIDSGEIWVDGISVVKEPRRAKAAVTTVFQETLFDSVISPVQALSLHARFYGARWSQKQICEILEEFGVTEPNRPIFQLSGGTKKKVELLKARLVETPVYIFDEPFAGLDQESRKRAEDLIRERKRQGKAILLVSHEPGRLDFVDRTIYMEAGRIVPPPAVKEVLPMLVEAVVRGWQEELRSRLEGQLQILEVQSVEPSDQEIEDILKSLGLDKLGARVQVLRADSTTAQEILKQFGGTAQTVSAPQRAELRTRLKISTELSLAQLTQLLEEQGLKVLEIRQL
ncbi:MAG: ABC transporter ATP-binding protein [Candidatus Bipolaricaulota bacterium]|nr:ABC transporter ATP-binding protein [Candidatus Bipolaricaulota bacterium]MDW8031196.1 ABC transporter ATP-binding protein [Candidatus Bipolaricaulota bacterium]